jgi:tetratricopeptide (TPR) repeat protein
MQQQGKASELFMKGRRALQLFEPSGYEEAVACFWEAIEAEPGFPLPYAALAEAYSYWGFRKEIAGEEAQSYYDLAYQQACEALKQAPQRAESHRAAAMALRRGSRANSELRAREARRAVELDPEAAENWYELWRALGYRLEDGAIRRALELNPALFAAVHDLAVKLCEAGDLAAAVERFRVALNLNPRHTLARYNLAMTLQRMGLVNEARRELAKADSGDALIRSGQRLLESTDARLN